MTNPTIFGYLGMINDQWRNQFYFDALRKHAADKVVLDVGTGTGILAFYALRFGAQFVYCVERSHSSAKLADQILADNFPRSRFQIIIADFWTKEIDGKIERPVDLLVTETVGPGLFDQGMFHTWTSAKPFLSNDAILIPDRLHCDLWFWRQEKFSPVPSATPSTTQAMFFPTATLDDDFSRSLIAADRKSRSLIAADRPRKSKMSWCCLNQVVQEPCHQQEDIVVFTIDRMPVIDYSDSVYPQHIVPRIGFTAEIEGPGTMSIVNKISFDDQTLFLKDAAYMPWRYAPTFVLEESGTYQFTYNNPALRHMHQSEWTYTHDD